MKVPRTTLNAIELTMWAALVAVVTWALTIRYVERQLQPFLSFDTAGALALGARAAVDLEDLAAKYGPARNSEHAEEWIVRDFFQDRRGGVFVDVGANHYRRYSNTYYLEASLGWSGLAIEPQSKFGAEYAQYRPSTTFIPMFVSDSSNRHAVLYVPKNDRIASFDRRFAETNSKSVADAVSPDTATLDDILDRSRLERIDFLSIDIELHEPQALAGFSIDRFRPALVGIEAQPAVRQEILDYFARHGYVVIGKYLRVDTENLWFSPAGWSATP